MRSGTKVHVLPHHKLALPAVKAACTLCGIMASQGMQGCACTCSLRVPPERQWWRQVASAAGHPFGAAARCAATACLLETVSWSVSCHRQQHRWHDVAVGFASKLGLHMDACEPAKCIACSTQVDGVSGAKWQHWTLRSLKPQAAIVVMIHSFQVGRVRRSPAAYGASR